MGFLCVFGHGIARTLRIPYGTQAGTIRTRADTVRVRDDAVRGLGTTVSKLTVSSRVCPSGFRMFVLFVYRSHVVRDGRLGPVRGP